MLASGFSIIHSGSYSFLPYQYSIVKMFKYTEKLKKLYSEHPCMFHIDATINILLYLLYHISGHFSRPLSIQQSIYFIYCCVTSSPKLSDLPQSYFVMLIDSVSQEFRQGTVRLTCHFSTMSVASAEKACWLGTGIIWNPLHSHVWGLPTSHTIFFFFFF